MQDTHAMATNTTPYRLLAFEHCTGNKLSEISLEDKPFMISKSTLKCGLDRPCGHSILNKSKFTFVPYAIDYMGKVICISFLYISHIIPTRVVNHFELHLVSSSCCMGTG